MIHVSKMLYPLPIIWVFDASAYSTNDECSLWAWNSMEFWQLLLYICGGKFYIALVGQLSFFHWCSFASYSYRIPNTVFGAVRLFNIFVTWTHRSSIFQNQTDHLSMGHLFSFNLKKYWHTQKKEHRPIKWQCLRLNGLFTMIYTCIGDWVKDSRKSQTKITAHFRSHNVY